MPGDSSAKLKMCILRNRNTWDFQFWQIPLWIPFSLWDKKPLPDAILRTIDQRIFYIETNCRKISLKPKDRLCHWYGSFRDYPSCIYTFDYYRRLLEKKMQSELLENDLKP